MESTQSKPREEEPQEEPLKSILKRPGFGPCQKGLRITFEEEPKINPPKPILKKPGAGPCQKGVRITFVDEPKNTPPKPILKEPDDRPVAKGERRAMEDDRKNKPPKPILEEIEGRSVIRGLRTAKEEAPKKKFSQHIVLCQPDDGPVTRLFRAAIAESRLVVENPEPLSGPLTCLPYIAPNASPPRALANLFSASLESMGYSSLREQLFLVDPRSTTPVAKVVFLGLPSNEAFVLMAEFNHAAERRMVSAFPKKDDWRWKWEKVRVMLGTDPPNPKHRELIETGRQQYAELLRDHKYCDIDVLYTNQGVHPDWFTEDEEELIHAGSLLYSKFAWNNEKQQFGMSVILPVTAMEKIFPANRKDVIVRVNTHPAEPRVEMPPEPPRWWGVDCIATWMHPEFEALGPNPCPENRREAIAAVQDQTYAQVWSEPCYRELGRANQEVFFPKFKDLLRKEPRWTKATNPVALDIAFCDDEWWRPDAERKYEMLYGRLEDADNATKVVAQNERGEAEERNNANGVSSSNADGNFSSALCKTFVSTQNDGVIETTLSRVTLKAMLVQEERERKLNHYFNNEKKLEKELRAAKDPRTQANVVRALHFNMRVAVESEELEAVEKDLLDWLEIVDKDEKTRELKLKEDCSDLSRDERRLLKDVQAMWQGCQLGR